MQKNIGIAKALSSDICQVNQSEVVKKFKQINLLKAGWKWEWYRKAKGVEKKIN